MKQYRVLRILVLVGTMILSALPHHATAQLATNTFNFAVNQSIPDNDFNGVSDTRTFLSDVISITELVVTLDISGGYNGDYYAYLTHGSGFVVLLNRPGRTAGDDFGYPDSGINVTFMEAASNGDIHNYRLTLNPGGGTLTGTWQPDGRNVHPTNSLDTVTRDATTLSFDGLDANGEWTLLVADTSATGTGLWVNWGVTVVGVPEPSVGALLAIGAGALWMRRRKCLG